MPIQHHHPTVIRLNREWQLLAEAPAPWTRQGAELGGCRVLGDVLHAVRREPDAVLRALLRLHAGGDALAGRVVLQSMLGKLVLMTRRDPENEFDDYLAEFWLRAAEYPLDRRPRRIAANLVLDTLKRVKALRAPDRMALVADAAAFDPRPDSVEGGPGPTAAEVITAARRLGLIDSRADVTLRVVYGEGLASRAAAERLGTTPEVVRWRCSRAVRRIRAHRAALVAA